MSYDDHLAAIEPVGDHARDGAEQQDGNELCEVDYADEEGRVGQAVDEQRLRDVLQP
jgi:hypothetical protein